MRTRGKECQELRFREGPIPGKTTEKILDATGFLLLVLVVLAGFDIARDAQAGLSSEVITKLTGVLAMWVCACLLFAMARGVALLRIVVADLRTIRKATDGEP